MAPSSLPLRCSTMAPERAQAIGCCRQRTKRLLALCKDHPTSNSGQVAMAFKRSSIAENWLTVVGEPAFASSMMVKLPVLLIAFGGGLLIVLAFLCAGRIGRRLLVDVEMLTQQASSLASGNDKSLLETSSANPSTVRAGAIVSEFASLSKAMTRADEALRDRQHRQMLLVREVDHRAKNALAVVQALVRLTPSDNVRTFRHAVQGRVDALARAHSVLAKHGWRATDLKELLRLNSPLTSTRRLWPARPSRSRRLRPNRLLWWCTNWRRTRPNTVPFPLWGAPSLSHGVL